jgi:hypothetical protein
MIEYFWDRRMIAVRDGKDVQHWQIDEPALVWTADNRPGMGFLLVFSEPAQAQWAHQMVLERVRDREGLTFARNRKTITNSHGGFMHFTTVGAALLGYQFDQIIMSDVMGRGQTEASYNSCLEWISQLRTKLAPNVPRPRTPDSPAEGSR